MIPSPPVPEHAPGTRVRVTQHVRVGHRRWLTQVEGKVVKEGRRPVGGIEMGGKAAYCQQKTLLLGATTARSPRLHWTSTLGP